MTIIVGIGVSEIEYCGSLEGRDAQSITVRLPVAPPMEAGMETRLLLLTGGQIEMLVARVTRREDCHLYFEAVGETIRVRRRLDARVRVCLPLLYRDVNAEATESFETTTTDISYSGLGVRLASALPMPERIFLQMQIPAGKHGPEQTISATGLHTNQRPQEDGTAIVGLSLLQMDAEHRSAFDQFIADRLPL